MKRGVKITLIVLGSIVVLLLIAAGWGWFYVKSTFLDFEDDYAENREIKEITVDGYTFLDRNGNGGLDIYEDDRQPLEDRVEDLLSQMTIDEKIHLLKGSGLASAMGTNEGGVPGAAGVIVPTPRLGIPTIYLSDGPAGLRIEPRREGDDQTYYCTAFPIATLLASSWNTDLVNQVGKAMGNEALEYGIDVILGPGANIHRHPLCGRNFEYYSEDPLLSGYMGAAMVNGIESNGVGASVKHYVANNQETDRNINDVIVSERAMREIYLKGFEIIVKESQPWTIMSSYNKVNGTYVSQSRELLTDILRDEWNFQGIVMTDWFGGKDAVAQVSAGNDLLEPGTKKQWEALIEAHEDGELSTGTIDTSVRRILRLILKSRKMENYVFNENPDLEAHAAITRQSATEGMVLLNNQQKALPLKQNQKVALIGVTSFDMYTGGTGSGDVNEAYIVSLEEGLANAGVEINERSIEMFRKHKETNREAFVRPEGLSAMMNPYDPPEINYPQEDLEQLAAGSDVAIITIGRNSGEGYDRVELNDFLLTKTEQEMIQNTCETFHAAGKKVIVVLNIGGVVETASWKDQPDGILLSWQGGQEGGNSIADILSGKVNPSGKLPMTFPINLDDHASNANFPLEGKQMELMEFIMGGDEKPEEEKVRNEDYTLYEEGIYVGYRHFDKAGLDVSYPFGYGLSYTGFNFKDLAIDMVNDTINISVTVENIGDVAGKEVVQLYVSMSEPTIDRPLQELKGFSKTQLLPAGATQEIVMSVPVHELRHWDEETSSWRLEPGVYEIRLGSSSRDIRLSGEINVM